MKRRNFIHVFAGGLVTISVILGYVYTPYWFIITLFVGLNLFQYGLTKWCLLDKVLTKIGMRD